MDKDALNKLAYFCDVEKGGTVYSQYILFLDGREVINVYAAKDELDHPIYVGKPFADADTMVQTQGRAFLTADGTRISAVSMQACVYKYMPWLIAAVYVPKVG